MRYLQIIFLSISLISVCLYSFNAPQIKKMSSITFVPEEFNNIQLGYYEVTKNACSPIFPEGVPINTIAINTPKQIICNIRELNFSPILPVCFVYSISERRAQKYSHMSAETLHIRKVDEDSIHFGEIAPIIENEFPILPPFYEEQENERLAKIEKAQKYNDDELDFPYCVVEGNFRNVNLMDYVDFPFAPGKYEVYLSFNGLESNHTVVEIVME